MLDKIISEQSWQTNARTFEMVLEDFKKGVITPEAFEGYIKKCMIAYGNYIERFYKQEDN